MKTKKVEIKSSEPNIIIIDGEEYICEKEKTKKINGILHSDKIVFKKYKKEEFIEDLQLIVKALAKQTTKQELLKEILKNIEYGYIRRLAKRIKSKKPIKKVKGCLGFKVGDAYVQLIG